MQARKKTPQELLIVRLCIAAAETDGLLEVQTLIENDKVDVNALHPDFNLSAFDFAAMGGSFETLRYLKEVAGANLDATNKMFNPLYLAVKHRNSDHQRQQILFYIASLAEEEFNDGTSKFHIAVLLHGLSFVKQYAEANPTDVTVPDKKGRTPFYYAVKLRDDEKMKFLVNFPEQIDTLPDLTVTELIKNRFTDIPNKTYGDEISLADILIDHAACLVRSNQFQDSLQYYEDVCQTCIRVLEIKEKRSDLPQTFLGCDKNEIEATLLIAKDSQKKVGVILSNQAGTKKTNANTLFANSPPTRADSLLRESPPFAEENNTIYYTHFDASFIARLNRKPARPK